MSGKNNNLYLGYRASSGDDELLALSKEDRRRHVYVIGQTGSGKTTFLKACLLQDILAGRGIALIDPHGDLAEEIIDSIPRGRTRDVLYFNPSDVDYPIGFNPLGHVPPEMRAVAIDAWIGANGQLGAVGDVNAGLFARQAVDQHAERRKEARHEGNEASVCGQIAEAVVIFLLDAVLPEVLGILER